MAAYYAVLDPGDTVLGLRLDHGGHLTHGLKVNFSGRYYDFKGYSVRREDGRIDLDEVRALALEHRPKLIVAGGSAYPREIDARAFREIADESGALLMVDMAHFSGLVAAGLHQNPVESADIVCSTTHKTLAGPRAGFILCRAGARAEDRPRGLPGPAGRAAVPRHRGQGRLLRDRERPSRSASTSAPSRPTPSALAEGITGQGGELLTGRHRHAPRAARPAPLARSRARTWRSGSHDVLITVNRNTVPYDERPPTVASGVRIGTPAATMRGLDAADAREVGDVIGETIRPDADLGALRARIAAILERRPLYAGMAHGAPS